jgi:hypothetical protein
MKCSTFSFHLAHTLQSEDLFRKLRRRRRRRRLLSQGPVTLETRVKNELLKNKHPGAGRWISGAGASFVL